MLYFAYGANLNLRLFKRHAPRATPIAPVRLDGHKLVFRRFIDIAPDKSSSVWGGLYRITPACERALDAYENFPALYRKVTVTVDQDGQPHEAMAYVMNEAELVPPAIDYFSAIVRGYRDWKLDPGPLHKARVAVLHGVRP